MKINSFDGAYGFLSNFASSPIVIEDKYYPTVEHYFQSMKTLDEAEAEEIRTAVSPGKSKRLGRRCTLRADWDEIKDEIMMTGLRAKFSRRDMQDSLLFTGDAILIEGNTWGDRYWGKDIYTDEGENRLGQLLMILREEIKNEEERKA